MSERAAVSFCYLTMPHFSDYSLAPFFVAADCLIDRAFLSDCIAESESEFATSRCSHEYSCVSFTRSFGSLTLPYLNCAFDTVCRMILGLSVTAVSTQAGDAVLGKELHR